MGASNCQLSVKISAIYQKSVTIRVFQLILLILIVGNQ